MKAKNGKPCDLEKLKEVASKLNGVLSEDIVPLSPLSTEERRRIPAARLGFERYAALIADAAREHDVIVKGRSFEAMDASIALSSELESVHAKVAFMLDRVADTIRSERAEAYKTFLAYYHRLVAIADEEPEVNAMLAPIVEFLTTQKHAGKTANADEEESTDDEKKGTPLANVTPLKVPA
ncbi:MAG: hypothetical protein IT381_22165 [Deltaproteobacteria bacterium]|nr:hypothetical protein [Deltaproteobacteria bacterium]